MPIQVKLIKNQDNDYFLNVSETKNTHDSTSVAVGASKTSEVNFKQLKNLKDQLTAMVASNSYHLELIGQWSEDEAKVIKELLNDYISNHTNLQTFTADCTRKDSAWQEIVSHGQALAARNQLIRYYQCEADVSFTGNPWTGLMAHMVNKGMVLVRPLDYIVARGDDNHHVMQLVCSYGGIRFLKDKGYNISREVYEAKQSDLQSNKDQTVKDKEKFFSTDLQNQLMGKYGLHAFLNYLCHETDNAVQSDTLVFYTPHPDIDIGVDAATFFNIASEFVLSSFKKVAICTKDIAENKKVFNTDILQNLMNFLRKNTHLEEVAFILTDIANFIEKDEQAFEQFIKDLTTYKITTSIIFKPETWDHHGLSWSRAEDKFNKLHQQLNNIITKNKSEKEAKQQLALFHGMPPLPNKKYWHKPQVSLNKSRASVQFSKAISTSHQFSTTTTAVTTTQVDVNLQNHVFNSIKIENLFDENNLNTKNILQIGGAIQVIYSYYKDCGAIALELWRKISCFDKGNIRYFDKITKEALQQILLFRQHFTSGINPDRLQEIGFFVREVEGKKVLCYDQRIEPSQIDNPLAIKLICAEPYNDTKDFEHLNINTDKFSEQQIIVLKTFIKAFPSYRMNTIALMPCEFSIRDNISECLNLLLRDDKLRDYILNSLQYIINTKRTGMPPIGQPDPRLNIDKHNVSKDLYNFLCGKIDKEIITGGQLDFQLSNEKPILLESLANALIAYPNIKYSDLLRNSEISQLKLPIDIVLTVFVSIIQSELTKEQLDVFRKQINDIVSNCGYYANWRLYIAAFSILRSSGTVGLIEFINQMDFWQKLNYKRFAQLTKILFPTVIGYKHTDLANIATYQAMSVFFGFSESEYLWFHTFVTARFIAAGEQYGDLIENIEFAEVITQFKYFFEKVREFCPQLIELPPPPNASLYSSIPVLLDRILIMLNAADDPTALLKALANQKPEVLNLDGWFYFITRKGWTVTEEMALESDGPNTRDALNNDDLISHLHMHDNSARWPSTTEQDVKYGKMLSKYKFQFNVYAGAQYTHEFPYIISINVLKTISEHPHITWKDFKRAAFRFIATQTPRSSISNYRIIFDAVSKLPMREDIKCKYIMPILEALSNKKLIDEDFIKNKLHIETNVTQLPTAPLVAKQTSPRNIPLVERIRKPEEYPSMTADAIAMREQQTGLIKNLLFDVTVNDDEIYNLNKSLENIHRKSTELSHYSNDDLKGFLKSLLCHKSEDFAREADLLACLREIFYRTYREEDKPDKRIYPNDTQIMAVWHSIMQGGNVVSGMDCGEGKTTISALQNAMLWCISENGKKTVEFSSTNTMLVKRDWYRLKNFYEFIGAHTAYISKDTANASVYREDGIYYAEPSNLSLFKQELVRQGKSIPKTIHAVLDEGDDGLLDRNDEFVLSVTEGDSDNPFGNPYGEIYPILNIFTDCLDHLFESSITCDQKELEVVKILLPNKDIKNLTPGDKVQTLWRYIANYPHLPESTKAMVLKYGKTQRHQDEMWEKLDRWINAARTSRDLKENRDFIIVTKEAKLSNDKMVKYSTATIIEKKETGSTGMPQPDAAWSDGVQQCVHARQEIKRMADPAKSNTPPFSCFSEYNVVSRQTFGAMLDNYIKRKNPGRVLANTGSVGSRAEIHHVFQSRNFKIFGYPPDKESQRKIQPVQYVKTKADQREKVLALLKNSANRPVIIQCADINKVEEWREYLSALLPGRNLQTFTAKNLQDEKAILEQAAANGSILISNICGRGVDITPDNNNEGLLAIETSIQTFRGSWQFYSRAGRQGMMGEAVAIYNDEETVERFGVSLLSHSSKDIAQIISKLQSLISGGISRDKFLIDMRVTIEDYVQKQVIKCINAIVETGVAREELAYFQTKVAKELMEAWQEIEKNLQPGEIFDGDFCPLFSLQESYYRIDEFFMSAERILDEARNKILVIKPEDQKLREPSKENVEKRVSKLKQKTLHKKFKDEQRSSAPPLLGAKISVPQENKSKTAQEFKKKVQAAEMSGVVDFVSHAQTDKAEPQRALELNKHKQENENDLVNKTQGLLNSEINQYLTKFWIGSDRVTLAKKLRNITGHKTDFKEMLAELNQNLVESLNEDYQRHWFRSYDSRFRNLLWQSKKKIAALSTVEQLPDIINSEFIFLQNYLKEELMQSYYNKHPDFKNVVQQLKDALVIHPNQNSSVTHLKILSHLNSILEHSDYSKGKHCDFHRIHDYLSFLTKGLNVTLNNVDAKSVVVYDRMAELLKKQVNHEPNSNSSLFGSRNYSLPKQNIFANTLSTLPDGKMKYNLYHLLLKIRNCLAEEFGVTKINAVLELNNNLLKLEFKLPIDGYQSKSFIMDIKLDNVRGIYTLSSWEAKGGPEQRNDLST